MHFGVVWPDCTPLDFCNLVCGCAKGMFKKQKKLQGKVCEQIYLYKYLYDSQKPKKVHNY